MNWIEWKIIEWGVLGAAIRIATASGLDSVVIARSFTPESKVPKVLKEF